MNTQKLELLLQSKFTQANITIKSDDNVHFFATIVDDIFQDKKKIQRQRMVYEVVGEMISSGEIHALSLKTYTKNEWEETCAS